ncbi:hypothetical protein [Buchnera aphidicola]|uniref:Uncharacterized protein n=1 Tax=Buchnera aphidicola (Lipaphis pseudobrassicae) TaxID=1258543 RepID=A0A4D6Y109_9GAMM|nr:hypothetical protein [Buchnera aphidicola]QCI22403.1 hypothetical protein D9V70_03010 [Buchnera aphidicola (Lipaphis pseudobrassicae)]
MSSNFFNIDIIRKKHSLNIYQDSNRKLLKHVKNIKNLNNIKKKIQHETIENKKENKIYNIFKTNISNNLKGSDKIDEKFLILSKLLRNQQNKNIYKKYNAKQFYSLSNQNNITYLFHNTSVNNILMKKKFLIIPR